MRTASERLASWLGVGVFAVAHVACSDAVFACLADEQCGQSGVCEAAGYCSFPDADCDSGRRYAPRSRPDLAGTCVPEDVGGEDTTGGTPGGSEGHVESGSTATTQPSSAETTSEPLTSTTSDGSTDADASTGATIERVTEGLLVLYRFDEGAGTTVHDQAGFGAPLDLDLVGDGFSWTTDGLKSEGMGIVLASSSPSKIRTACQMTNELTIEAWVTPEHAAQPIDTQPARIVTWSRGSSSRNFSLGQGVWANAQNIGEGFSMRLRTSDTDASATPFFEVQVAVETVAQHLLYTRSADGSETLYLDGSPIGSQDVKTGDFSNWTTASDHGFALANEVELASRGWAGELHLVALYDRALSEAEILQNFTAGWDE